MDALKPYFDAEMEICEVNGVILLQDCRVIVPQELQSKVITMLHQSHHRIVRMKTMARLYVWWPNIEMSIETCCKACNVCVVTAPARTASCSCLKNKKLVYANAVLPVKNDDVKSTVEMDPENHYRNYIRNKLRELADLFSASGRSPVSR